MNEILDDNAVIDDVNVNKLLFIRGFYTFTPL